MGIVIIRSRETSPLGVGISQGRIIFDHAKIMLGKKCSDAASHFLRPAPYQPLGGPLQEGESNNFIQQGGWGEAFFRVAEVQRFGAHKDEADGVPPV